ncbi:MAG: endolytic transglycosylase MltG [Asticcacaulis sp.]|nr:endolytic transglycosylase MltG [Asticcacaulis sp.]
MSRGGVETRKRSFLAPLMGLFGGAVLLTLALVMFSYSLLFSPGPRADTEVTFPRGMSVTGMGHELEKQGVIRSAAVFRLAAKLGGRSKGLHAGTYLFPKGASMMAVLKQIEDARVEQTYVTVPEGRTSAQAVRALMATPGLAGDVDVPPEGSILPESYLYQRGETRQAVLDRMLLAGRKTLDDLWVTRAKGLPFTTKEQALIMASVVERETGKPDERPRVAAVFVNRLRKGMRLESDPTVIYGITHGEPLGRGLLKAEVETPTPWNTYTNNGLPVTPIGNPGRASIAAVLNPAKTEDLYFVADGTGGHVFAATYEQHLANVAHWREIEGQVNHYSTPAFDASSAQAATSPAGVVAAIKPSAAVRLRATSH